jgi:imidazolonepropionase-like amidohydrolase
MHPSTRAVLVCILLLLTDLTAATCLAAESAPTWILSGAKIYPAPDAAPIVDGVLLLRAGKVAAIGARGAVKPPPGVRELGCQGGVVTAGYQNSHVHLTGEQFSDAQSALPADLERHLQEMLTRYGFTTVVDTASDRDNTLALRSLIESGKVRGPRILTVGLPLYPHDGIPFYLADLPKPLLDRLPQPATADEALAVVRENLRAGVDGTKLFVATPQGDRSVKLMPTAIARAAAAETHAAGKLVMAHPTNMDGVRIALAAKVDILVHTTLGVETAWPAPVVRQLIEQKTSLVPTLQLWGHELDKGKVPQEVQERLIAATLAQLKGFASVGGQVLFGTDVGYMTEFDPTVEYELMSKAGLTPMQILASLTTAPAARWNEADRRGRLDVGMDADIVVLDADPAEDARNFAKVRCAFRGAKPLYVRPTEPTK